MARRALLYPYVVFAFSIDRLRRLPFPRPVARAVPAAGYALLVGAGLLLVAWGLQRAPQRISLADLAAGKLSAAQSWIIVSGDLAEEPGGAAGDRNYLLTDPSAPNARLLVSSTVPLPVGRTTVSGTLEGGREPVSPGFVWSAQLEGDAQLAQEVPVPWGVPVMAVGSLLIAVARRTSYPVLVREVTTPIRLPPGPLSVGVRGSARPGDRVPATLNLDSDPSPGVTLVIDGTDPLLLHIHSAFSGVDVGELLTLSGSEPALRLQPATGDLTISFATRMARDGALTALVMEAARRGRRQTR